MRVFAQRTRKIERIAVKACCNRVRSEPTADTLNGINLSTSVKKNKIPFDFEAESSKYPDV